MRVMIVGCGRVGSAMALHFLARGDDVVVIDSDADALLRVGEEFPGEFFVGEALDTDMLERAGIEQVDAFVAATDGDNTNLVIAQVAQKRYGVETVVVRVFDPARAEWYGERGLHTVCPTEKAITSLVRAVETSLGQEA